MQNFLIEQHDVFAKHGFDVGYNTELKVKLPPAHDLPVYVPSPPTLIFLRDKILIELALMQKNGMVTFFVDSKCFNPIIAQRKPSSRLKFFIDLRRMNHLLRKITAITTFRDQI